MRQEKYYGSVRPSGQSNIRNATPDMSKARMLSSFAGDLGAVAGQVGQIALEQREAKAAAEFTSAQVQLDRAYRQKYEEMQKAEDYTTIPQEFDAFAPEAYAEAGSGIKDPKAREHFDRYAQLQQEKWAGHASQLHFEREGQHILATNQASIDTILETVDMDPTEKKERVREIVKSIPSYLMDETKKQSYLDGMERNVDLEALTVDQTEAIESGSTWVWDDDLYPSLTASDKVKAEAQYKQMFAQAEAEYQQEVQYRLNDAWENETLTREQVNAYAGKDHRGFRGLTPGAERMYLNAIEVRENKARAEAHDAEVAEKQKELWGILKDGDAQTIADYSDQMVESGEWTISQALTFQSYGERMADKPESLVGVARELKRKGVSFEQNEKAYTDIMDLIESGKATKEDVVKAEPLLSGNQIKLANLALNGEADAAELKQKGLTETTEWGIVSSGNVSEAKSYRDRKIASGDWTWQKGERFVKKAESYAIDGMDKTQKELYRMGVSAQENDKAYEDFMDRVEGKTATAVDLIEVDSVLTRTQSRLAKLAFKEMESETFAKRKRDWNVGKMFLYDFLKAATVPEDSGGGGLNSFDAITYRDEYGALLENKDMTRKEYLEAAKSIVQQVVSEHPDTMPLKTKWRKKDTLWQDEIDAIDAAIKKSVDPAFDPSTPAVDGGKSLDDIFGGMGQ